MFLPMMGMWPMECSKGAFQMVKSGLRQNPDVEVKLTAAILACLGNGAAALDESAAAWILETPLFTARVALQWTRSAWWFLALVSMLMACVLFLARFAASYVYEHEENFELKLNPLRKENQVLKENLLLRESPVQKGEPCASGKLCAEEEE